MNLFLSFAACYYFERWFFSGAHTGTYPVVGGYHFLSFQGGGAHQPFVPETPLETKDFNDPGGVGEVLYILLYIYKVVIYVCLSVCIFPIRVRI